MYDNYHLFTATTSTLDQGNMSFRFGDPVEVLINRRHFLETLRLSYDTSVVMQSNHKDIIQIVDSNTPAGPTDQNESLEADALITQTPGVTLFLTTADCLPVTLYCPKTHTLSLIHLSRHTFVSNLLEKTLTILMDMFGADLGNIQVVIGPHIHSGSYCFETTGCNVHPKLAAYIHRTSTRTCINLAAATVDVLTTTGVAEERIFTSPIDTFANPNYFSHVRSMTTGEPEGRLATVACLMSPKK